MKPSVYRRMSSEGIVRACCSSSPPVTSVSCLASPCLASSRRSLYRTTPRTGPFLAVLDSYSQTFFALLRLSL